jgi:hemolysin activation/secretion protein
MTFRNCLAIATALSTFSAAPVCAQSRQAPIFDVTQPQQTLQRLQRDQQLGSAPVLPKVAAAGQRSNGKPLFRLHHVALAGAISLPSSELAPAYAQLIGRRVTTSDLSSITEAITIFYRKAGWHLSRAIIKPQNAEGGRLKVSVVEGRITDVIVRGSEANAAAVRVLLEPLTQESPSNRLTVERALLLASDLPGVRIQDTSLEEIETGSGNFRLIVDVESWLNYTSVAIDNRGTKAVGPVQTFLATNFNAAFRPGDTLGVALSTTPADTDQLRFGSLSYSAPVGTDGSRISLLALHSEVKPGDYRSIFNTQNRADFVELRGTITPIRTQDSSLWLSGAAAIGEYGERDIFGRVYADHLRTITGTAEYHRQDALGGTSYLTVNVKQGLPILGASAAGDAFLSRSDSSGEFTKIDAYYSRVQTLVGPWSIKLAAAGQLASRSLLASQQFYLGAAFARGLYGLQYSGDNAAGASVELRYDQSLPWQIVTGYQLYGYIDHTRVWNINDPAVLKLTLAGAGVRFFLPSALQATIEVASPIEYAAPLAETRETRVFFGISKAFKFCSTPRWTCG